MDLSKIAGLVDGLDIPALRQLTKRIEDKITEKQDAGRRAAIEQLTAEAAKLGFDSLEDLIGMRKRGRPRSSTNGHADDSNEGRSP